MVVTLAQNAEKAHRGRKAHDPLLARFCLLALVNLWLLAMLVFGLFGADRPAFWTGGALAFGLYLGLNGVLLRGLIRHYPHERLGLCNVVTHFRATLTAGLAAVLPTAQALTTDPVLAWSVVAIATIALACDGIDGWAARRSGLASSLGARFDMEVDSLLALILALIVWQTGKVGDWVLFLGLMRYLFVAAMWLMPWLNRPTPQRFSGKLVCVIQIAALIALLAPVVTGLWAVGLAGTALALVIWSFGVDIRFLWQTRAA
ncbi:CDP-alcohol phosphatidyltransferase family protein [Yoonia vestfoldensis]|uniref:CDP-alcohol phosphatidyltransferase family protein n=1 Tax=Yoonia vestfoldensis TaxID=245188 RepID=UPI00036583BD|nr:CDP-alcohol phosphatidyltransferase family protein [Yoonia vestfoldensis]